MGQKEPQQKAVQHTGRNNLMPLYRLRAACLKSSLAKKDLEVLVDIRLNVRQKYAFVAEKANCLLDCISKSIILRLRELTGDYSALV